jgi:hypothetical protein
LLSKLVEQMRPSGELYHELFRGGWQDLKRMVDPTGGLPGVELCRRAGRYGVVSG